MKRYIRIDLEYESTEQGTIWQHIDNIKRILREDMPYLKIINTRDSPDRNFIESPVRKP